MNLLVTAGNTLVPIDRVRCLTNIFTGRTGTAIALAAHDRGHNVTLLTSHPEVVGSLRDPPPTPGKRWAVHRYRTFADLQTLMGDRVCAGGLDGVIHCAAVSDYLAAGIYAPAGGTRFDPASGTWHAAPDSPPRLEDRGAGKVKSDESELWLRLVRAPKIVDRIRGEWGFCGVLVKFKLEVGVSDERLLEIAERSRQTSAADLMVANTLEGSHEWAFLGAGAGNYQRVARGELAERLLDRVERAAREKAHG